MSIRCENGYRKVLTSKLDAPFCIHFPAVLAVRKYYPNVGHFFLFIVATCVMILVIERMGGVIINGKKKYGCRTDHLKDIMFRVRIDEEMNNKLEKVSDCLEITKSEVVRKGIAMVYDSLKKK